MEQDFDARGNGPSNGNDARGIAVDGDTDARGNEVASAVCSGPECHNLLWPFGPGRRPDYCGRSCSSRAYRQRRSEKQQDAVANALIASRVETMPEVVGKPEELLGLAQGVERLAARFLQELESARQGGEGGGDPRAQRTLERLERGIEGVMQRMLRRAHVLRFEMLTARSAAGSVAGGGVDDAEAAALDPSRVESVAASAPPSRAGVEVMAEAFPLEVSARISPEPARRATTIIDSTRDESTRGRISSRVENIAPAQPAVSSRVESRDGLHDTRPQPPASVNQMPAAPSPVATPLPQQAQRQSGQGGQASSAVTSQPRLALDTRRSAPSPADRNLGEPELSQDLGGGLEARGWRHAHGVITLHLDGRMLGWAEQGVDGLPGWTALVDGRLVLDADDGQPLQSREARFATELLRLALEQRLI